ncbi:LOW QUALITY PROTEIN: leucine-rich repeat-containing protein 2 [Neosynchiropus ocellatus]
MGPERPAVPVHDVSLLRGLWEVRVRTQRQRQQKEQERKERSALEIEQQWQYRGLLQDREARGGSGPERAADRQDPGHGSIFQLDGPQWTDFPRELQWQTYLQQWHVTATRIRRLPDFLPSFTQLTVLQLPGNLIADLPPQIGQLSGLQRLDVSYNRLSAVPPALGLLRALRTLDLAGNRLRELPFELSSLKTLTDLDVAENRLASVPVCVLRMGLQRLNLSHNQLRDLPQDMDRLQQLDSLFVHNNSLSYLPQRLADVGALKLVVVSGAPLTCVPTKLCSSPHIKFVRLYDRPGRGGGGGGTRGGQKEFLEAYVRSLQDRDAVPYSTTKVSISCQL